MNSIRLMVLAMFVGFVAGGCGRPVPEPVPPPVPPLPVIPAVPPPEPPRLPPLPAFEPPRLPTVPELPTTPTPAGPGVPATPISVGKSGVVASLTGANLKFTNGQSFELTDATTVRRGAPDGKQAEAARSDLVSGTPAIVFVDVTTGKPTSVILTPP